MVLRKDIAIKILINSGYNRKKYEALGMACK